MINFFIKHKKARGVITIFFTLTYLSTYLLIGIFVDGGRVRMARTAIEDAQQIATANVMANYNRGLYEYYGLFGLSDYTEEQISNDIISQVESTFSFNNTNDKYFDPYGLRIDKNIISTKHIDLADKEALRSQIRDEMRYTAPLVLGSDFFDTINAFMSLLNGVKAIKDVTEKISNNSNEMEEKQKSFVNALDAFSLSYKDFIETSYRPNNTTWGKMESLVKSLGEATKNAFNDLKNWLVNIFVPSNGSDAESSSINDTDEYEIETNLNLKGEGGLQSIINSNKEKVLDCYRDFDVKSGWPQPSEFTEEDEEGRMHYDQEAHEDAVYAEACSRADEYKSQIDLIIGKARNAIMKLDETINPNISNYMDCIGIVEMEFKNGCDGTDSTMAKNIYMQYMMQQLDAWNELAKTKKNLISIRDILEQVIDVLNSAKRSVDDLCDDIRNEVNRSWHRPNSDLKASRDGVVNRFNELMKQAAEEETGMVTVQKSADTEKFVNEMLKLLNNFGTSALKTFDEYTHIIESDKDECGNIILHEEHIESRLVDMTNLLNEEINEKNILNKMLKIFDWATQMLESVQYELFANIYDETYILSHCRDYVHSFRYEEEELYKLDAVEKAVRNIDTVLNPKFIEDRHKTNYLSDKQLKKLKVTPAEIEYILHGDTVSYKNVEVVYWEIYWLRFALNCISAMTTNEFKDLVKTGPWAIIAVPCGMMAYAYPKTESEIRSIMFNCEKVNIINIEIGNHIWDAGVDRIKDFFKEVISNEIEDLYSSSNEPLLESVKNNNIDPEDSRIIVVTEYLKNNAKDIYMQHVETWGVILEKVCNINSGGISALIDLVMPKAGYSYYITMFLYHQGWVEKDTQISRLQDVIETNMSHSPEGQSNFRLKNTYSQISVEANYSVKYLFMTQQFMQRTFSNTSNYKDKEYQVKVKTAFAY